MEGYIRKKDLDFALTDKDIDFDEKKKRLIFLNDSLKWEELVLPIVTKADIINDFINYYMTDSPNCYECNKDEDFCCIKCSLDRYLAETER